MLDANTFDINNIDAGNLTRFLARDGDNEIQ